MTESENLSQPADTMRERAGESRFKIWFLISADRWVVTALLSVGTFVLIVLLGTFGPSSIQTFLLTDAIGSVFGSIIIATVTSVTLVLTVAQLVLSQDIGTLGDQRQRLEEEIDFRRDIENVSEMGVSPAEPSVFLQRLIEVTTARAGTLAERAETANGEGAEEITTFASGVIDHGEKVNDDLKNAEFGSFEVLLPVLNYNYAWKVHAALHLRHRYAESFTTDVDDAFEELLTVLRFFSPAREYFKAQYLQWQLIDVSRAMLYGSLPALAICAYMMVLFDPTAISNTVFGVNTAFLFFSAIYTLTLVPFAILLAYILRLLTTVKRTLAIGPFLLRETEQVEQFQ